MHASSFFVTPSPRHDKNAIWYCASTTPCSANGCIQLYRRHWRRGDCLVGAGAAAHECQQRHAQDGGVDGHRFSPVAAPLHWPRVLWRGNGKYRDQWRSEEHTSELQSLMRISYAVFCLKKKNRV